MKKHSLVRTFLLLFWSLNLAVICLPVEVSAKAVNTTEFECNGDAYVDSSNPNLNYRNADLHVSYYSTLSMFEIAYLAFTVSDLPSDAIITEVLFEISVKYMPLDDHTTFIRVYETNAFNEDTITWNNRPSDTGNKLVHGQSIDENRSWRLILTDSDSGDYKKHSATGNGNYYFKVLTYTDSLWGITFDSRDDYWNPPILTITYQSASINSYTTSPGSGIVSIVALGIVVTPFLAVFVYVYYFKKKKRDGPASTDYTRIHGKPSKQKKVYWLKEKPLANDSLSELKSGENILYQIKSKHLFRNYLSPDEQILFWNESHTTIVVTNKRVMIHSLNVSKSGGRKPDRVRHEYIFPIANIVSIFKGSYFMLPTLSLDVGGSIYSFGFAPGTDQYGRKVSMNRTGIVHLISQLVVDQQHINYRGGQQLESPANYLHDYSFANIVVSKLMLIQHFVDIVENHNNADIDENQRNKSLVDQ